VVVISSPGCPHCSAVVAQMLHLGQLCPRVDVRVIDLARAGAWTQRFGIRAVPAVVVDDDTCLEGHVTAEEIAGLAAERGGPDYDHVRCRALLAHGRVADVAMSLRNPPCARVVVSLLAAPELSFRMGAQLAVREAFERDAAVVHALLPDLMALLSSPDRAVRGDLADLLGTVGDDRVLGMLHMLARDDDDSEVREAARESIDRLASRGVSCS